MPRFRRMFNSVKHAKNMVWHSEKRIDDGMLRHHADAAQWKSFDLEYKDFSVDTRNLRLGLASDGMNPLLSVVFGKPETPRRHVAQRADGQAGGPEERQVFKPSPKLLTL